MNILVMNAGSSSQKSCLYQCSRDQLPDHPLEPLWDAQIDWTKQSNAAELTVKTAHGETLEASLEPDSRPDGIADMLKTLWQGSTQVIERPDDIQLVGHRVVHGGADYQDSTWITPDVKEAIARLIPLAPAHNPANLEGIDAVEQILGHDIPQVAVFDTAFHSRMPQAAIVYPGPYDWLEQGIRRYGFHGISHQYCARRAAQILGQEMSSLRIITCHLGNGCSLAAIQHGYSINTTMGFTPLEGLMMGSRSGSVDPGLLIHLLKQHDYTAEQLNHVLNRESGLKGISGISNDMRQIDGAIAQGNERAQLALDIFVHRLKTHIGAMMASLGGLDVLVFTAGIGEHHPPTRALACEAFEFLGLKLDNQKNERSPVDVDIARPESTVRVVVVHTLEDWAIAQECWQLARSTHQH
ncbi:MAG TPA: acetate kinase [Elainellaceae cyanobacterium]